MLDPLGRSASFVCMGAGGGCTRHAALARCGQLTALDKALDATLSVRSAR